MTNLNWVDECSDFMYDDWKPMEANYLDTKINGLESKINGLESIVADTILGQTKNLTTKIETESQQLRVTVGKLKTESARLLTKTNALSNKFDGVQAALTKVRIAKAAFETYL